MTSAVLSARGIGRRSPTGDRWLLRGADLDLAAGERLAVTGPSGSGKSVLLRSLALLDPLDEGEIRFHGSHPAGPEVPGYRSRVLYLHQQPVLLPGSVRENLLRPLRFRVHRGRSRVAAGDEAAVARAEVWLETLGRRVDFLDQPAAELSVGEAQIAALLRALLLGPEVLLLDEPTASLDEAATAAVEALVAAWYSEAGADRAYLWVTHLAAQNERVAARRLRVVDGRLAEETEPADLGR